MKARLVKFGEIEVETKRYTHDVVIDGGKVRKRKKGPSKQFREKFGHTPLSAGEEMLWGDKRLIVLSFIQDKNRQTNQRVILVMALLKAFAGHGSRGCIAIQHPKKKPAARIGRRHPEDNARGKSCYAEAQ